MAGRGHHHMPALPPFGVVAAMADDKSHDAVIPRINSRHRRRVKRAVSPAFRYQRPGRVAKDRLATKLIVFIDKWTDSLIN